jgi:hypothetical protein
VARLGGMSRLPGLAAMTLGVAVLIGLVVAGLTA